MYWHYCFLTHTFIHAHTTPTQRLYLRLLMLQIHLKYIDISPRPVTTGIIGIYINPQTSSCLNIQSFCCLCTVTIHHHIPLWLNHTNTIATFLSIPHVLIIILATYAFRLWSTVNPRLISWEFEYTLVNPSQNSWFTEQINKGVWPEAFFWTGEFEWHSSHEMGWPQFSTNWNLSLQHRHKNLFFLED